MLQGDYIEKWYVKLLTATAIKAVKYILPLLFDSSSYAEYGYEIPLSIINIFLKLLPHSYLNVRIYLNDRIVIYTWFLLLVYF